MEDEKKPERRKLLGRRERDKAEGQVGMAQDDLISQSDADAYMKEREDERRKKLSGDK